MTCSSCTLSGRLLAVLAGACVLAGCAEPLTYSRDFKRQGLRQYNLGDYADSAGSFKAAAKQDPTDYQTQYYLGVACEKTGDYQTAVEAYRLCLKLRPQMPAGRADIAMREKVLSRLAGLIGRGDFAEPEINSISQEAAAEQSPDDYRLLARVFALRGDADSAVESYRHALSFADGDFLLTKEYAFYLLKLDQTAEGTRMLRKAWELNSSDRQVAQTLRDLGVTDAQLVVSSTKLEDEPPVTPNTAWDVATAPKD